MGWYVMQRVIVMQSDKVIDVSKIKDNSFVMFVDSKSLYLLDPDKKGFVRMNTVFQEIAFFDNNVIYSNQYKSDTWQMSIESAVNNGEVVYTTNNLDEIWEFINDNLGTDNG